MSNLKICAFADEASSNITEQVAALNRNGIGLVEVRGVNGKNVSALTLTEAKEARKIYNDNGIDVWSIGSPIGKIKITDDFNKEMELFKNTVDIALAMNAQCIRLFSFYGTNGEARYKDEVMEKLSRYVEAAKGSGVVLCHENERDIYGENAQRCLEIVKCVPELKNIFDAANYILCGQEIPQAWQMLKDYTYYHHIKDATKAHKIVPAGYGDSGMKDYLADYSKMGGGVLTLEPHLHDFVGLAALAGNEDIKNMGEFKFGSNDESFDFAAQSLNKLIAEI